MQNYQKVTRARTRVWLKFCTVASICILFMNMTSFWLKLIFSVFSRGGPPGGHFSPVLFLILEQVWLLQSLTLRYKSKTRKFIQTLSKLWYYGFYSVILQLFRWSRKLYFKNYLIQQEQAHPSDG